MTKCEWCEAPAINQAALEVQMTLEEFTKKIAAMSDEELSQKMDDVDDDQQDAWAFIEAVSKEMKARVKPGRLMKERHSNGGTDGTNAGGN